MAGEPAEIEEWSSESKRLSRALLEGMGVDPNLLEAAPSSAIQRIDKEILQISFDEMSQEERERIHVYCMTFLAEVLMRLHGGRWSYVNDPSSPLAGRYVIVGMARAAGDYSGPVDVAQVAYEVLSGKQPSFVDMLNRAEVEADLRAF
ncbi:hypothetical protein ACL02U_02475 [Streptomyces sp. MS06]|uniref:hypothetical protein n=1 Tax=Streptomyces sp. MS06 TaxID=3385974 RepID=UPI00399F8C60